MTATLRPMGLGEILDRTFQIYRSRFAAFLAIAALPALVVLALQLANQRWWRLLPEPIGRRVFFSLTPQDLVYLIAVYQGSLLLQLVAWPAYAELTSRICFEDHPTLSSAVLHCAARWRRWLGLTLASWGTVSLLPEIVAAGLLTAIILLMEVIKIDEAELTYWGPQMLVWAVALGLAGFLWMSAAFSFAFPIWAVEGLKVRAALRRSLALSKGGRLKILFVRVLVAFIGWLVILVVGRVLILMLVLVLKGTSYWWRFGQDSYIAITTLAGAAISALISPIFPIALTLFYYDQRIRREGYDIEKMMEDAGLIPAAALLIGIDPPASIEAEEIET